MIIVRRLMRSLSARPTFRSILSLAMVAWFLFAPPMAVAVYDSLIPHEGALALSAAGDGDHSHDRDESDQRLGHFHDPGAADHSHETGGMVMSQIAERLGVRRSRQSGTPGLVDPDAPYSLDRPPRSRTAL